ncbi:Fic family protein [Xanthobacteraceae bacterium A53D]
MRQIETTAGFMEPMMPEDRSPLTELTYELTAKSHAFVGSMNPVLKQALGNLVRSMNCYYSNLIEGHETRLIDIERALKREYSSDAGKRDLQLEARAHIEVQCMIDFGRMPHAAISEAGIKWLHGEFYDRLPPSLRDVRDPETGVVKSLVPGEYRDSEVAVGRHIAPEPQAVPHLMFRFVDAYASPMLGRGQKIIAAGASHHRFGWIHPFLDGNGRVGRLMSHAYLRELGIGSELWSVSRGLARSVSRYKAALQRADEPRQGERDGRGSLTEQGLAAFCHYFLATCIDQIDFMQSLLDTRGLLVRAESWTEEEVRAGRLMKGSWALLREALLMGAFERGAAPNLTGYKDRQARSVLADLLKQGLLESGSHRSQVRIAFPAVVVERWFPGLYSPASTGEAG